MLIDIFLSLWISMGCTTFLYSVYIFHEAKQLYETLHSKKISFSFLFWFYYVIIMASICLVIAPISFINVITKKKQLLKQLYKLIEKNVELEGRKDE